MVGGLKSFGLAVTIALIIRWGIAEAYVIPSGSMLPSLLIHDHIFVNKLIYGVRVPFTKTWIAKFRSPERGEVIVFKDPRNESIFLIKRVVGIPGDKISYNRERLFVNGQAVETRVLADSPDFDLVSEKDVEFEKMNHQ